MRMVSMYVVFPSWFIPPSPWQGGESGEPTDAPLGQGSCREATEGWTELSTPSPLRGTPPWQGGELRIAWPSGKFLSELGASFNSSPDSGEVAAGRRGVMASQSLKCPHTVYPALRNSASEALLVAAMSAYSVWSREGIHPSIASRQLPCPRGALWAGSDSPPGSGGVPRRGEGVEHADHPSVAPCPRGALWAGSDSPPGSGGVPRRGEGVEHTDHPSVATRQLPCPRGALWGME